MKKINNSLIVIKNNQEKKKIRQSNIELLRFICSIFIIFLHIGWQIGINNWLFINFNSYVTTPVILFCFLTGYFLANNNKTRFFKFLLTILFYYFINIILRYLIIQKISWDVGENWWYLFIISLVYILAPTINISIKNYNKKSSIFTIFFFYFLYYFFYIIFINPENIGFLRLSQLLFLLTIYSFGVWWKNFENEIFFQNNKKIIIFLAIFYLLLSHSTNLFLFWFSKSKLPTTTNHPLTLFSAFAIFIIFQQIKLKNNFFINYLGLISLPIYLFHYLFQILFYNEFIIKFYYLNENLKLLLLFILTAPATTILSFVLIYIKIYFDKFIIIIWNKYLSCCSWRAKSFSEDLAENKGNIENEITFEIESGLDEKKIRKK